MTAGFGARLTSLLVGGVFFAALSGCGVDDACDSLTEPLVVAGVELSPVSITLRAGQTHQFAAVALTSCGNPVPGAAVTWASADPALAVVTPTGLATALDTGVTTITATSEGKSAAATLRITVVPVATVTVFPNPVQLEQGATLALTVSVADSAGNAMSGHRVRWASSDSSVASVNDRGEVTGLAAGGPVTISATVDTASGRADVTVTRPPPASLVFAMQPGMSTAGAPLTPAVQVVVADRFGIPVAGDGRAITVALGAGPGSATLAGTGTVAAVDGVATFTTLMLEKAAAGYTLVASAPGLTSVTSQPFAVIPGAAADLRFSVPPAATEAGVPIAPAVAVEVIDAFGNTVTDDTAGVQIGLGQNPGGATLSGTTTVQPQGGEAAFGDLTLNKAGSGYTLIASRPGIPSVSSIPFVIRPGPAATMRFTVQPSDAEAGVAIAPGIEVTLFDTFDNIATTDASSISLSIAVNPGGGSLSGVPTSTAASGVAVFPNVKLEQAGAGYTLRASRAGIPAVTSAPFAIRPGPAAGVVFAAEPADATAGSKLTPAVQVAVVDAFGNRVTTSSATVSITLSNNPGGSSLSGATTAGAVQGLATFADLSLNRTGAGYTLGAAASGLSSATSRGFTILPGPPASLVFRVQPSETPPHQPITPPVEVSVLDSLGNVVTTTTIPITITLALNPGSSTLSGTRTRSAVNGVAVFDDLSLNQIATGYRLSSGAPGLASVLSASFDIKF